MPRVVFTLDAKEAPERSVRASGVIASHAELHLDARLWHSVQPRECAATEPTGGPFFGGGGADLARMLSDPCADLIRTPIQFNYDEEFGAEDAGRFTVDTQTVIPLSMADR